VSDVPIARLRRLAEELEETGLRVAADEPVGRLLLEEIDQALRPVVHERRVASSGTIIDPASDPDRWAQGTQLDIVRAPVGHKTRETSRRFVDGLSSWLVRRTKSDDELLMFDRPAGSERDLVVLADAMSATLVQRHPSGSVRVVGAFGVLRWEGLAWHHEAPVTTWIDAVTACGSAGDPDVLGAMLEFAVHDLGSQRIGALLIYRPESEPGPAVEELLPVPPPLHIRTAFHLAPLRHALSQIDGAAVFDDEGVLRQLGVRVVPSATAEETVAPLGGTRHTAGRRYSYDDPSATVIAVSDDGPVSVLRNGKVLGRSAPDR
jgi:DNA integrity scanning protein DisA with diadenylate cyclase activity